MLRRILNRKKGTNQGITDVPTTTHKQSKSGTELLSTPKRSELVRKIKRLYGVTNETWVNHYLYAIEQFAEIIQEVPASQNHHHSNSGGLIDHTLEVLFAGTRIALGHILPPNCAPEEISGSSDRWRFGVLIAILAHDIGKVLTDMDIVYRVKGEPFKPWHPWYGNIPLNAEYVYRYKDKTGIPRTKTLHEQAAMSMVPKLMKVDAAEWLFQDTELLCQLFSTITHSTFGGGAILDIVRAADKASVSTNLGAYTGVHTEHSSAVPLHEKVIVSLRNLISDGELKKNKPGAAIWVTETETWVVSKTTIEAVRLQLTNEGHKGIPKNVVRIFQILEEHDMIIAHPEGESVWKCNIEYYPTNWKQSLTFLRFKNETLWTTSAPVSFDGKITPVDKKGNPIGEGVVIEDTAPTTKPEPANVNSENSSELSKKINNDTPPISAYENVPSASYEDTPIEGQFTQHHAFEDHPHSPTKPEKRSSTPSKIETKKPPKSPTKTEGSETQIVSSAQARKLWTGSRKAREEELIKNHFIGWLIKSIEKRRLRVNEAKAPVHILEHHVALVTPTIFIQYFKVNQIKKLSYEKRAGDKKIFTLLQKELETLDIHQRSMEGQNMAKLIVEGPRKATEMTVYLLDRKCFPSLSNFSANKALKIKM